MLYFEMKKLMKTKRMIMAVAVFTIATLYAVIMMCKSNSIGSSDPFLEFQGASGLYQIVILFLIIVVTSSFFPVEMEFNLTQIIAAAKYGRGKLALAKVFVALMFANSMFLIYVGALYLGFFSAFRMGLDMPIIEGEALEYMVDPGVRTFGDIIILQAIGMFLSANFTAALSLFLSSKLKKAFSTAVIIIISYTVFAFLSNVPLIGMMSSLTPICLTGRAITYKVLLSLGSASITILHVGFIVYIILIMVLLCLIKSVYKTK